MTGDLDVALLPFRAAVAAGVRAVMTAHLLVPALDDVPATVSRRSSAGLREELRSKGLVVTDALEMRGLAGSVGVEEGAVLAPPPEPTPSVSATTSTRTRSTRSCGRSARLSRPAGCRWSGSRRRRRASGRRLAGAPRRAPRGHPRARSAPRPPAGRSVSARARASIAPRSSSSSCRRRTSPRASSPTGSPTSGRARSASASARRHGPRSRARRGPGPAARARHPRRGPARVAAGAHVEVLARRPEIVVETGLPGGVPAAVETLGAGRANLEAAVAALAPLRARRRAGRRACRRGATGSCS